MQRKKILSYNLYCVKNFFDEKKENEIEYFLSDNSRDIYEEHRKLGFIKYYNGLSDRTNNIKQYLNLVDYSLLFTIPKDNGVKQSYKNLVNERAKFISKMDSEICVLWSGGLDSTLALMSILEHRKTVNVRSEEHTSELQSH